MKVRILPKSKCWPMRFIGLFSRAFREDFWTVYRLPFQGTVTISYPDDTPNPPTTVHDGLLGTQYRLIIRHELVHARLFWRWFGPPLVLLLISVFPLPAVFSGRWWLERWPYLLVDIMEGDHRPAQVADFLWRAYGWPWPRKWMAQWLKLQSIAISSPSWFDRLILQTKPGVSLAELATEGLEMDWISPESQPSKLMVLGSIPSAGSSLEKTGFVPERMWMHPDQFEQLQKDAELFEEEDDRSDP